MNKPRIEGSSNLAALARINPCAANDYAGAILRELKELAVRCSVADPLTSAEDVFAQVHALKNAVSPTGDRKLIEACAEISANAALLDRRREIAVAFLAIIEATISAVMDYRNELATASSTEASASRLSGL
jgi:hypothetical protein